VRDADGRLTFWCAANKCFGIKQAMDKQLPNPVDEHVGSQVRMRRKGSE
jgi:hypothetical protein